MTEKSGKVVISDELSEKQKELKVNLQALGSVAVCFSGGVDSSFLLAFAHEALGDRVIAVTAKDASVPERKLKEAKTFCEQRGIRHIVCTVEPLKEEGYRHNSPERCYFCKRSFNAPYGETEEQTVNSVPAAICAAAADGTVSTSRISTV